MSSTLPTLDLTARPFVWFSALPPLGERSDLPFADGSTDYFDLFTPNAPWETAAQPVNAYKVTASWLDNYATDEQVRAVVATTADRGQALALEIGPLSPREGCGSGEGFDSALDPFRRIEEAGGRIDIVAFDEPYAFAHALTCDWPVELVASVAANWVRTVRGMYPDILIGDIEPLWREIDAEELGAWMDAYREATGAPLDFFQVDADWTLDDWPDRALAAMAEGRSRGIPTGLIYNGGEASSDEEWFANTRARIDMFEGKLGGQPDQLIFQSWMDHPDRVLPDTDPNTFTGLIRQYFAPRTSITLDAVEQVPAGRVTVSGTLLTREAAAPVPDATIGLAAEPIDGAYQVLTLEGQVPAGATDAVVGLRANTEDAGPGPVHITAYEISYVEDENGRNLVPNPSFTKGPWGYVGTATVSTVASDHGGGLMLRVDADPDQDLNMDSGSFAVSPGAPYTLSAAVGVPAASAGNVYLAVIFLDGTEVERHRLVLAPQPVALGDVPTSESGAFVAEELSLEPGRYRLRVDYAGDIDHWPSYAEMDIIVVD